MDHGSIRIPLLTPMTTGSLTSSKVRDQVNPRKKRKKLPSNGNFRNWLTPPPPPLELRKTVKI